MRSPDKQRIYDAIAHKETGEIPFFEMDMDMGLVNQILNKDFSMGMHCFELEAEDNLELNLRAGNDLTFFGHVWHVGRKEMVDDEGRIHYVERAFPIGLRTRRTRARMEIAPTGRFRNDCQSNFVGTCVKKIVGPDGRERSVVEKESLDTVRKSRPIFEVLSKILMNTSRSVGGVLARYVGVDRTS
jgi:hypothetical protein